MTLAKSHNSNKLNLKLHLISNRYFCLVVSEDGVVD